MNDKLKKKTQDRGEVIIYQGPEGLPAMEVHLEHESIWLNLNQIAALFERDKSAIFRHLHNIYAAKELGRSATVAFFATVQNEGGRSVERQVEYYNLDAILSVGYRVNSKRGTQFRIWATNVLRDHLVRGVTINRQRIETNAREIEAALELARRAVASPQLTTDMGRGLVEVIARHTQTVRHEWPIVSIARAWGHVLSNPGGLTMRKILVATCLATILIAGQASAADRAHKAEAAENKAGVLEQNSAAKGSKTPPSRSEIITKTEAQAVDPVGEEPLDDAITCLSRTIYWEAKNEGAAGMEAIASVVMNRLGHKGFPNTICGVVRQGHEQGACQFSWWCDGRSDDAEEDKHYAIAKEIGRKALNRQLPDRTGGAMYFHQRKATPGWSVEYIKTVEIGEHIFYKPHGGVAK